VIAVAVRGRPAREALRAKAWSGGPNPTIQRRHNEDMAVDPYTRNPYEVVWLGRLEEARVKAQLARLLEEQPERFVPRPTLLARLLTRLRAGKVRGGAETLAAPPLTD
jgi:hypothetical protein